MKENVEGQKPKNKRVLPCGTTTPFCKDCETGCAYAVVTDD